MTSGNKRARWWSLVALKPARLGIQLMCFDITVTKMQAERKQRDSEDPRESDTHREMEKDGLLSVTKKLIIPSDFMRRLQPKKKMPKTTVRDKTHMTAIWTTLVTKRLRSSGAAATKPLSVTTEEKLQQKNSSVLLSSPPSVWLNPQTFSAKEVRGGEGEARLERPVRDVSSSARTDSTVHLRQKRLGNIDGDWSRSPVYCGSTGATSHQGVQTGTAGGSAGRTGSRCIEDYSALRWTATSVPVRDVVRSQELFAQFDRATNCSVYPVMLSALNTLPERTLEQDDASWSHLLCLLPVSSAGLQSSNAGGALLSTRCDPNPFLADVPRR
ncbi:hypothetical protein EYF80_005188 [Liparis tanakae]|uniref:Uncharacterized protein n=1 Tax=Liparis tanakae TaxID=230148 RepID=A0A4Z2J470_9TELE|nr:hypothetical protein EYF80_005188 [Liparis tanakae]